MPILFFADRLPPHIGGVETHAQYFIDYFSEHSNFPLIGIVSKDTSNNDILINKNKRCKFDLRQINKLFEPAILFFNSGRWIEKLRDIRSMFPEAAFLYRTGGNEILQASLAYQNIAIHKDRQHYWVTVLNQTIDYLITNSAFTEERLRNLNINSKFNRCVGGVNTTFLSQKVFKYHSRTLNLFCAARFVPYKNYHLLISVIHELILRGYAIHLKIAGDGPLLNDIQAQVKKYRLESKIKFLGAINNEAVCQEMVVSDAYIQLSSDYLTNVQGGSYIHSEGMGRSILEAISVGTFVIAGRSGALSEVVNADRGILIRLTDAKEIADQIEPIIKQLPKNLTATDAYSWQNLFKQYEHLMMKLKI